MTYTYSTIFSLLDISSTLILGTVSFLRFLPFSHWSPTVSCNNHLSTIYWKLSYFQALQNNTCLCCCFFHLYFDIIFFHTVVMENYLFLSLSLFHHIYPSLACPNAVKVRYCLSDYILGIFSLSYIADSMA